MTGKSYQYKLTSLYKINIFSDWGMISEQTNIIQRKASYSVSPEEKQDTIMSALTVLFYRCLFMETVGNAIWQWQDRTQWQVQGSCTYSTLNFLMTFSLRNFSQSFKDYIFEDLLKCLKLVQKDPTKSENWRRNFIWLFDEFQKFHEFLEVHVLILYNSNFMTYFPEVIIIIIL